MTAAADQIPGIYSRHAAAFDRLRSRALCEKAWLDRFLSVLHDRFARSALPKTAAILDLGCGCGEPIASYLVDNGCSITGVDTSPDLLGLCRQRFPEQEWLLADMRGLSLERCFQGVVAWDSFFHLTPDDQRAMFKVFADHLAPGGALMFTRGELDHHRSHRRPRCVARPLGRTGAGTQGSRRCPGGKAFDPPALPLRQGADRAA